MRKSTLLLSLGKARPKHAKPSPDFPLFSHATGRWAKKIRGKLVYFGRVADDPLGAAALVKWQKYILAGRVPGKAKPERRGDRPGKPYLEFPLFAHATKRWAKKIRGSLHYFGPWDDPDGALAKYLEHKDDLHAGRAPRSKDGTTLKDLAIVTPQAWSALRQANHPPTLFRVGGVPSRIEKGDEGRPIIRTLDHARMYHHLARAAAFFERKWSGGKMIEKATNPPKLVVSDMLATPRRCAKTAGVDARASSAG